MPGLLRLVFMEDLHPDQGWTLLADLPEVPEALEKALDARLTELHAPVELSRQGEKVLCVHGDMRAVNIFVRCVTAAIPIWCMSGLAERACICILGASSQLPLHTRRHTRKYAAGASTSCGHVLQLNRMRSLCDHQKQDS